MQHPGPRGPGGGRRWCARRAGAERRAAPDGRGHPPRGADRRCPDGARGHGQRTVEPIEVDAILVGTGREPNVEGLGLEAAGVSYDAISGVRVDEAPAHQQSARLCRGRRVHRAEVHPSLPTSRRVSSSRTRSSSAAPIPAAWWSRAAPYTDPEVASVGMDARLACRARAPRHHLRPAAGRGGPRRRSTARTEGFVKIHVRPAATRSWAPPSWPGTRGDAAPS